MLSYSTSDVHPRDRSMFWMDMIGTLLVRHQFKALDPLEGSIAASEIAQFSAARYKVSRSTVIREASHIRRDGNDDYHLTLINSGCPAFDQFGRIADCNPGGLVLLDVGVPITTHFRTETDATCLTIPRKDLEARLGSMSPHLARFLSGDTPLVRLAATFLKAVVENHSALDATSAPRVHEQALDMLAIALSAHDNHGLTRAKATSLARLKAAIATGLTDPHFSAQDACSKAGLSARYANSLLSAENTSVERLIYRLRLERIRMALADPAQSHRKISDIALSWGFSDPSHFARRFRDAFGTTPREFRDTLQSDGRV